MCWKEERCEHGQITYVRMTWWYWQWRMREWMAPFSFIHIYTSWSSLHDIPQDFHSLIWPINSCTSLAIFQPNLGILVVSIFRRKKSSNGELVVWGPVVWDSNWVARFVTIQFQKEIPNIQTTGPQTINVPLWWKPAKCLLDAKAFYLENIRLMEEIRRSPPVIYETLWKMGYSPYQLVIAGFLNHQQYH